MISLHNCLTVTFSSQHGLILLLLKPYLVKPPDNETANFAFDRCADASERIAKVVQQYQAKPTFRRVPNSVYQ